MPTIDTMRLENILFIDIETVPMTPNYSELPENYKKLWDKKSAYICNEEQTAEDVYERAGIYAEFGKIICISAGYILEGEGSNRLIRIKSFSSENEAELLSDFSDTLNRFYRAKGQAFLCAHNGKEFDFPYISRRMLINGVKLPIALNVQGLKPWETTFLDTLELWKFGDFKHYTSLELLSAIFNIPTPKGDIDGSMVADVYYKENDLARIVKYCENDVLTVARLFFKLRGEMNAVLDME